MMIRSLVATSSAINDEDFVPRRNLSQEELEKSLLDGDLMWIDVVDAEEEEIHWLERILDLHPVIVEDLMRNDRRPALLVYPRYLFLSLFQPAIKRNKVEGKEIHCVMTENCFVTVRMSETKAVDDAYNRVAQNPDSWKQEIAYFLYLTTQYVIDGYYPPLDRISNQLNQMEENLLSGQEGEKTRRSVYNIKQQLINLRQIIAPQREVLSNVIGENRLTANGEIRDLFRHLYERLLRVYDVIDAQRDLSSNVLDLIQSQSSNKLVETVNRLTIFSMIFLPLTFLSGLLELNFATTSEPVVLPITGQTMLLVVISLMILSAVLMTYVFRRRGWI